MLIAQDRAIETPSPIEGDIVSTRLFWASRLNSPLYILLLKN